MERSIASSPSSLPSSESRSEVISHLKEQLPQLEADITSAVACAYKIAGLMASDFARTLSEEDPIDTIFTIAGELEVNPHNAEALRQELIGAIKAL